MKSNVDHESTLAVVQARMGSSRFPGKVLAPFCGDTVLGVLMQRLERCRTIRHLVLATTTGPEDDAVERLAHGHDVPCIRGHESDVLGRFVQTLDQHPAETIVRICADSPLTDPQQIDYLVSWFAGANCDYAYNNLVDCGIPGGLGGEILRADTLRLLDRLAVLPEHREHVTLFLWDNREGFRIGIPPSRMSSEQPFIDLDVDYEEDLSFLRLVCSFLSNGDCPLWGSDEIIEVLRNHPKLAQSRREPFHRRTSSTGAWTKEASCDALRRTS